MQYNKKLDEFLNEVIFHRLGVAPAQGVPGGVAGATGEADGRHQQPGDGARHTGLTILMIGKGCQEVVIIIPITNCRLFIPTSQ